MMLKKACFYLIFLLIATCEFGCQSGAQDQSSYAAEQGIDSGHRPRKVVPRQLKGTALGVGSEMGNPKLLHLFEENVYWDGIWEKHHLHHYILDGRSPINHVVKDGKGPYEALGVDQIFHKEWSEEEGVWVHDMKLAQITHLQHIGKGFPKADSSIVVKLTDETRGAYNPLWISDSFMVALDLYELKGRFMLIDSRGKLAGYVGENKYGFDITGDFMGFVKAQAYFARLTQCPSQPHLIAISYFYTDIIEVWDIQQQKVIKRMRGPDPFEAVWSPLEQGGIINFAINANTRYGFTELAATSGYLFALYSGRVWGEYEGMPDYPSMGKEIYVFDWHGQLQQVLEVDTEVQTFQVSSETQKLYVLGGENEMDVYVYDLKDIIDFESESMD